jgi:hypothetical protein
MAGILNNKERVMDFTITQEGKRQAGTGEMRINYATFTDLHTFYDTSGSAEIPTLAADASDRIFFETFNRYQDVIVPELEAGLSMRPFRTQDFNVFGDGSLASGSFSTGLITNPLIVTGSLINSASNGMLDGLTNNFQDQRVLGTVDLFSLYQNIEFDTGLISFIAGSSEYLRSANANLDDVPSIISDKRFSQFPNFKFLPPVNGPLPGIPDSEEELAKYVDLSERYKQDQNALTELEDKTPKTILFDETSRNNNLAIQLFEQNQTGIEKLSLVDMGSFVENEQVYRVVMAGKILLDSSGAESFVNVFTLKFRY